MGVISPTGDAQTVTITYMRAENFAAWLRTEMDRRNLNQSTLARKSGISSQAVSAILNQYRDAGPEICLALAKGLKLSPLELYVRAGLLPEIPGRSPAAEEAAHLIEQLPSEQQQFALDFLRSLVEKYGSKT